MKKLYFLLAIMPLFVFSSCSDDMPSVLTGTSWVSVTYSARGTTTIILDFVSRNDYEMAQTIVSGVSTTETEWSGTYVYDRESGDIMFDEDQLGSLKDGVIKVKDDDGVTLRFVRQ